MNENIVVKRDKRTISVVAAIIVRDGEVFATQRGYGDWKGWWEFPGGKVKKGESPEDALRREIREELASDVAVGELFATVEYDYPDFHLSMQCFLCSLLNGELKLLEHQSARWLSKNQLNTVKWLPADESIILKLKQL